MLPLFIIPLCVGVCIQGIKILIDFFFDGKIQVASLRGAGGFPSVHSGMGASICTLMYLVFGWESAEFALAFIFSFLFRYDAANVRYEAGQHASFLNKITDELSELKELFPHENTYKPGLLKERLGHTVGEVIGGIVLGVALTTTIYLTLGSLVQ